MHYRNMLVVTLLAAGCPEPVQENSTVTVNDPAPQVASAAPKAALPAAGTAIPISPANGKIEFVGSKVTGSHKGTFQKFSGEITVGDKLESSSVRVEIEMSSVVTDSAKLDGHLKSDDFFAVGQHPKATFTSTSISAEQNGQRTVTGQLQLRGVTKEIRFPAMISVDESSASVKAAFSINRQDFGVKYPGMPDDLIRDEVQLSIAVDAQVAR